ncbi:MAG: hypothetical protein L6Q75_19685 [Burkholderiaceae bacterium]|nr:hypothetical protein [Burkholderiaceae bacterium]
MRKHTRRRHHDVNAHPVRLAMLGPRPPTDAELVALRSKELLALAALAEGRAAAGDLFILGRRVLVAAHIARMGIGPEVLPLVPACRRVLDLAKVDPVAAGQDAEGVAAMRDVLDLHDQQRCAMPAGEAEAAIHAAVQGRRW